MESAHPARADSDAEDYFIDKDLFARYSTRCRGQPGMELSFDDGYASDMEIALPALLERGLSARFFPLAGKLGRPGYLTAAGVRELAAAGMALGSHGMRHRSGAAWTRGPATRSSPRPGR